MAAAVIKSARRWEVKNWESEDPLVVVAAGVVAIFWGESEVVWVEESEMEFFGEVETHLPKMDEVVPSFPSFFSPIPPVPHLNLNLLPGWNHFQWKHHKLLVILVQMINCYKSWELVINSQQFLTLSDSTLTIWISNIKYTWVYTSHSILGGSSEVLRSERGGEKSSE